MTTYWHNHSENKMAKVKDVDGTPLNVGDIVEIVNGDGAKWFRDKVGQHVKIEDIYNDLIYAEGSGYDSQFGFRFRKVDKMKFTAGDKVKYNNTGLAYTVVYTNEHGALLNWSNDNYSWIGASSLKGYVLFKAERWAYLYKGMYNKVVVSSDYDSEQEAREAGKRDVGDSLLTVIKVE